MPHGGAVVIDVEGFGPIIRPADGSRVPVTPHMLIEWSALNEYHNASALEGPFMFFEDARSVTDHFWAKLQTKDDLDPLRISW
ncbi:MAG: hypothetical protein EXR66_07940 [Dehalococcoidia bacterium]|nr:hypothetical protein [Dehalococcoidia bacterium]